GDIGDVPMRDFQSVSAVLPQHQRAIRAKCFHPSGAFVPFQQAETEQSVPSRFEQIVAQYPDRIAVKTPHYTLTYTALNTMANQVAWAILAQAGEGNAPIALLLEHDAPMLAGILGVLKAGKICVPLDPSYPAARAATILEHAQAHLILTNAQHLSMARQLAQSARPWLNIDALEAPPSSANPNLSIAPDTFAYLIYTSGSTGQPKGVIQNHRNLLHNALRYTNSTHIGPADRITLFASLSTGQGAPTTFCALLNGASVYPITLKEDGGIGLAHWLITEELTVYIAAATVFRHFVGTLTGKEHFPQLRLIRLGAEP